MQSRNNFDKTKINCPVSKECGACTYIDVPYEKQLLDKQKFLADLFESLLPSGVCVEPVLGMHEPYYYRAKVVSPFAPGRKSSKMPMHTGKTGKNKGKNKTNNKREILTGMYATHSHRLIPNDECLLENKQAKAVIAAVRKLMYRFGIEPYNEDTGLGFMRHAVVRVGHESGEVLVTLVTNSCEFPHSKSFCRELCKLCPFITTVVQNINLRQTNVIMGDKERTLYGPGFILDKLCGLSFRVSSKSFYQINARQTEVLYRSAIELACLSGTETVIDAYCGTGTIGLVAAKNGAACVIGVDSVASAINDAKQNARHNGVKNAKFITDDAANFMRKFSAESNKADKNLVLFIDPPRAGCSEDFLDAAAMLAPSRIVYISCNPQTQARDVKRLGDVGYEIRKFQPVDMFPHTSHVETVVLLSKVQN